MFGSIHDCKIVCRTKNCFGLFRVDFCEGHQQSLTLWCHLQAIFKGPHRKFFRLKEVYCANSLETRKFWKKSNFLSNRKKKIFFVTGQKRLSRRTIKTKARIMKRIWKTDKKRFFFSFMFLVSSEKEQNPKKIPFKFNVEIHTKLVFGFLAKPWTKTSQSFFFLFVWKFPERFQNWNNLRHKRTKQFSRR